MWEIKFLKIIKSITCPAKHPTDPAAADTINVCGRFRSISPFLRIASKAAIPEIPTQLRTVDGE